VAGVVTEVLVVLMKDLTGTHLLRRHSYHLVRVEALFRVFPMPSGSTSWFV
jgi:hypothetical protein